MSSHSLPPAIPAGVLSPACTVIPAACAPGPCEIGDVEAVYGDAGAAPSRPPVRTAPTPPSAVTGSGSSSWGASRSTCPRSRLIYYNPSIINSATWGKGISFFHRNSLGAGAAS